MPKPLPIDQQLAALGSLRSDPASESFRAQFTAALGNKSSLIAARAATIITELNQTDFLPQLVTAFDRFFVNGADKGCPAKTAIANALYTLGHNDAAAFLRGIHYVQKEASFGPSVDVAAELRGICGLGLTRMGYPDVLLELGELLMDPEPQPRQIAARAIAYTGSADGAPLLRMKVLAGDSESEVIAECFVGLMKLSPKKSLPFVRRFLKSHESAALAIGGSKTAEAFEILHTEWKSHLQLEPRRPPLLAIAMTRQPAAIDFLLERIAEDRPAPAADAIGAMDMYKNDEAVKAKVRSLIDNPQVAAAFKKTFGE